MKKRAKRRKRAARPLSYLYAAALRSYLTGSGETALRQAYEVGRSALSSGHGVLDMVEIHLTVLGDMFRRPIGARKAQQIVKAEGEICLEALAPFEMAHRGFREANAALRHLNQLLEQEARRIGRELHDETGQLLAAVHLTLEEAAYDLPDSQKQRLTPVKEILKRIEEDLRRISHELRPLMLDDLGLAAAVRFLAEGVSQRTGLAITVEAAEKERFPAPVELALYRVVQEALTNAAKHSRARRVSIELRRDAQLVSCAIQDDGKGFPLAIVSNRKTEKGLGLIGMRERVGNLGGSLEIKSDPGKGTRVLAKLPLGC